MRPLRRNSVTDHCTAECAADVIHQAIQGVELSASLTTFLEFALEMAEDAVKDKTALARWMHATTHAAHTDEPLRLYCRAALASSAGSLTVEVEPITGTSLKGRNRVGSGQFAVALHGWRLERLACRGCRECVQRPTLWWTMGPFVSAGDVDAKLLINCRRSV